MKANSPAERLLVDHINENERKREAQRNAGKISEQADQSRLNDNELANLPARSAQKTKQPQFAAPIDYQSQQSAGNAHYGDEDGNGLQRVSDRKRAVEDAQRLAAQVAIGEHQHAMSGSGPFYFRANVFHACIRGHIDGQI